MGDEESAIRIGDGIWWRCRRQTGFGSVTKRIDCPPKPGDLTYSPTFVGMQALNRNSYSDALNRLTCDLILPGYPQDAGRKQAPQATCVGVFMRSTGKNKTGPATENERESGKGKTSGKTWPSTIKPARPVRPDGNPYAGNESQGGENKQAETPQRQGPNGKTQHVMRIIGRRSGPQHNQHPRDDGQNQGRERQPEGQPCPQGR
jgi:hypothetical protein